MFLKSEKFRFVSKLSHLFARLGCGSNMLPRFETVFAVVLNRNLSNDVMNVWPVVDF